MLMKDRPYNVLFFFFLLLFISCKGERTKEETGQEVLLNEAMVTAFARQIESSVRNSHSDFLNNAFDKQGIKQQLSDNSIVYSSLDADFGKRYYERYFLLGDEMLRDLDNGGDVRFVRYYIENEKHHIILRTYVDFSIRIDDYIVDTVDGALKIVDGFLYNVGSTFVNNVRYGMLFDVLQQTNPEGNTTLFSEAVRLMRDGEAGKARTLLEQNRELLSDYPNYTVLLLRSVYESAPKHYLTLLTELREQGWDERSFWLHTFLFRVHQGNTEEAEKAALHLIEYTGDDPIYLYLFGLTSYHAGNYEQALFCYENAVSGMPVIWDIWFGKLQCFYKMKRTKEFVETLNSGKELYGMTDQELEELMKKRFSDMDL